MEAFGNVLNLIMRNINRLRSWQSLWGLFFHRFFGFIFFSSLFLSCWWNRIGSLYLRRSHWSHRFRGSTKHWRLSRGWRSTRRWIRSWHSCFHNWVFPLQISNIGTLFRNVILFQNSSSFSLLNLMAIIFIKFLKLWILLEYFLFIFSTKGLFNDFLSKGPWST